MIHSQVGGTSLFHCWGLGFNPVREQKYIPQVWQGQKTKQNPKSLCIGKKYILYTKMGIKLQETKSLQIYLIFFFTINILFGEKIILREEWLWRKLCALENGILHSHWKNLKGYSKITTQVQDIMCFVTIHLKRFRNFRWYHAWHHRRPGPQAHGNKWEGSHTWSRPVPAHTALEIKDRDKPVKATGLLSGCLINPCLHEWMVIEDVGNVGRLYLIHWAIETKMTCEILVIWRRLEIKPPKIYRVTCVILTHVFQQRQS